MKKQIVYLNIFLVVTTYLICFFNLIGNSTIASLSLLLQLLMVVLLGETTIIEILVYKKPIKNILTFLIIINIVNTVLGIISFYIIDNVLFATILIGIISVLGIFILLFTFKLHKSDIEIKKERKEQKFIDNVKENYTFFDNEKYKSDKERSVYNSVCYMGCTYVLLFIGFLISYISRYFSLNIFTISSVVFMYLSSMKMNIRKYKVYQHKELYTKKLFWIENITFFLALMLLSVMELYVYNGSRTINFIEVIGVGILIIPMSVSNKIITDEYYQLKEKQ